MCNSDKDDQNQMDKIAQAHKLDQKKKKSKIHNKQIV